MLVIMGVTVMGQLPVPVAIFSQTQLSLFGTHSPQSLQVAWTCAVPEETPVTAVVESGESTVATDVLLDDQEGGGSSIVPTLE